LPFVSPTPLEKSQQLYDAGQFAEAIQELEGLARDVQAGPDRQAALSRIAAISWYRLKDSARALEAISRLDPARLERSEIRIILEQLTDKINEDLRSLVRRGDRREAFRQLRSLLSHLPAGIKREELVELYTRELGSHYLVKVEDKLSAVNRHLNLVSSQLAKLSAGADPRSADAPIEEVECRLRTFQLSEERERLLLFRAELSKRELRIMTTFDLDRYVAFVEGSKSDRRVDELLETVHRLCLEKMRYKTTLRLESKDHLTGRLPGPLARYFTSEVYLQIQALETKVANAWSSFLADVYR
jgi:hypothetical protein